VCTQEPVADHKRRSSVGPALKPAKKHGPPEIEKTSEFEFMPKKWKKGGEPDAWWAKAGDCGKKPMNKTDHLRARGIETGKRDLGPYRSPEAECPVLERLGLRVQRACQDEWGGGGRTGGGAAKTGRPTAGSA